MSKASACCERRRKFKSIELVSCCQPPGGGQVVFRATFPNTLAPFVPVVQQGIASAVAGNGFATLTATSPAPNPDPNPAGLVMVSPTPVVIPVTQDFCLSVSAMADIPEPFWPVISVPVSFALSDISGANAGAAGILYDFVTGEILFRTTGPGGTQDLSFGPVDTLRHRWRITGLAASQSYLIQKDSEPEIAFMPVAGRYPQVPLSAVVVASALSAGPGPAQNRMVMHYYCCTAR